MPNHGVSSDATLLDEEVEFGGHVLLNAQVRSLDEEAFAANVQNSGHVVAAVAAPAEPDILRCW
jgi:hypothetical protein